MKEVIALQQYTDKYVSLYEGQIRNIEDKLANELITKGIVRLHTDIPEDGGSGGGSGAGSFIVSYTVNQEESDTDNNLYVVESDKTLAEIISAIEGGQNISARLYWEAETEAFTPMILCEYNPEVDTIQSQIPASVGFVYNNMYILEADSSNPAGLGDQSNFLYHGYDEIGTNDEYINFQPNDIWLETGTQFVTCSYNNNQLTCSHTFRQIINFIQTSQQNVIVKFVNYNSPYENQRHYLTLLDTNVVNNQRIVTFGKTFFHPDGDRGVGIYVYTLQFRQNSDPALVFRRYDLSHGTFQNIITVGSIYE